MEMNSAEIAVPVGRGSQIATEIEMSAQQLSTR